MTFYQTLGFGLLYGGPEAAFTSFRVGDVRTVIWGRAQLMAVGAEGRGES